ncbi:hypothetical protein F6X38_19570 [Aureimonas leprariae]|uniref:Uncharacterized protein n=2 Tax=Plantimonas leprariae TaxID=2615207 RepID=A0A7V7PLA4_9HYPH|nr:hypothetical protein F6X38_19570 [Aureimonas leprariae]
MAEARTGLFRATLLFGSAAAALSLIVVPMADRQAKLIVAERASDLDAMTTGSIGSDANVQRYTIRRSVLDRPDRAPCIMFPDGRQTGAC